MLRFFSLLLITGLFASYIHFNAPGISYNAGKYPEELPGAYTGGFGEESCHSCHFDYPLNPEEGSLSVSGIPNRYEPKKNYQITVSIDRKDLGRAGFQLTSRFTNGSQAGFFKGDTTRIQFTDVESTIQYIQHTAQSSKIVAQKPAKWVMEWRAPDSAAGEIIFNVAANAGNGDVSSFGDYIYVQEIKVTAHKN